MPLMASATIRIVLSIVIKRDCKRVNTGSRPTATFWTSDWVGSGSEILTDCHLYYAEQRRTGFVIYHPVSLLQNYAQKNAKIIGMAIAVNRE